MAHAHGHGHARAGRHSAPAPLRTALVLTVGVAALEVAGGMYAHSLALLSDAAHVFMDALALGIAVAAQLQVRRPATERRSFGYARFEILAALLNGGLLFAVTLLIALEAVRRLAAPQMSEGGVMAAVAALGFAVNAGIGASLFRGARDDLNVKSALYHVASDAFGALLVVAGGLLILVTREPRIDAVLSLVLAAVIVFGVVQIVREAAEVLLESVPAHASLPKVRECMRGLAAVVDVHDLHIWTIGSGSHVLSAHVLLQDKRISEASALLRELETRLHEDFDIDHVTIQFECESCEADDRIICTVAPREAATPPVAPPAPT